MADVKKKGKGIRLAIWTVSAILFLTGTGRGAMVQAEEKGVSTYGTPVQGATGDCGTEGSNVTWVLYDSDDDSTGDTLVISGEGDLYGDAFFAVYQDEIMKLQICDVVHKLVIEQGVTSIGDYQFCWFHNLESVEIPDSVKSIGKSAFWTCAITSVRVPGNVKSIGASAFSTCENLKSVEIAEGVEVIGTYAFSGCSDLTEIKIPATVNSIEYAAFWQSDKLINLNVDEDNQTFFASNGILYSKDRKTLIDWPTVPEVCKIPEGVESIGDNAFDGCSKLSKVEMPDSVTSIGIYAFSGCDNLVDVKISRGLESIGEYAFYACDKLTKVEIPSSIKKIGDSAFSLCERLSGVYIAGVEGDDENVSIEIGTDAFGDIKRDAGIYLQSSNITLNGSDIGVSNQQILQPYTISCMTPNYSEEKQIIAQVYADGKQSYTFKEADLPASTGMVVLWQDEAYNSGEGVSVGIGSIIENICDNITLSIDDSFYISNQTKTVNSEVYGYTNQTELSVTVTSEQNNENISYQWQTCKKAENDSATEAFADIPEAKSATYFIETGKETGTYLYRCKVTKTDGVDGASIYSIPVSFTVTKKPITVSVKNKSRDFGEENPVLNLAQDIEIPKGALVGDDTIEELGITLTINATPNSPKGVYQITGTSESSNYDVTITNGKLFIMTDKPDVMPKDTYAVEYTVETLAQAKQVLAQQLPAGWVFCEAATDAETVLLAGGAGVITTVEYVAEDKNCYYTTTKQVTITRAAASGSGETAKDDPNAESGETAKDDPNTESGETGKDNPSTESGDSVNGYPTVETAEKKITTANTDKGDVEGSTFAALQLKATGKTKSVKLTWKKVKGAEGYIIYGAKCGKKMEKVATLKGAGKRTYTQKKLKAGTYYKYMVAAYKTVDGKQCIMATSKSAHAVTNGGKYANPTKVSVKSAKMTIKKGKKQTIKASLVMPKGKKNKVHNAKFRYESSNTKVATVNKNGVVTAKKKGTAYIYVYAQNGVYKKVNVSVK